MVSCDTCNRWYHTKCIIFDNALADEADYYLCKDCFNTFYRPLMHYVSHAFTAGKLGASESLNNIITETSIRSTTSKNTLRCMAFPVRVTRFACWEICQILRKTSQIVQKKAKCNLLRRGSQLLCRRLLKTMDFLILVRSLQKTRPFPNF